MTTGGQTDTRTESEKQQDARTAAIMATVAQMFGLGTNSNKDASQSQQTITRLTPASARALLQQVGVSIQYTQQLTDAEVKDFIDKFNTEQNKQIQQVVQSVSSKTVPGADKNAIQKTVSNTVQTEYPSFFQPAEFAKSYLWNKINFKSPETLGGQNLQILQQVQQVVKDFNLLGYSDAEALAEAKNIAMGKETLDGFKAKLSQIAIKEYPNLASRFQATPGLTTKDIASPVINMLAKEWEMDPSTIGFDNPIVAKWLRPVGADGKETTYSYTDALREARNDPKWQQTTTANDLARSAATALIRAFTGGI